MSHTQEEQPLENRSIKGITVKHLVWFAVVVVGGLASIQTTVLGVYFKQDNRISTLEKEVKELKDNETVTRADVVQLKEHKASVDARLENLKPISFNYGTSK